MLRRSFSEIPFSQDASQRFVYWIVGLLFFLLGVFLSITLTIDEKLNDWSDVSHRWILIVPYETKPQAVEAIFNYLKNHTEVSSADILDASKLSGIVEHWLNFPTQAIENLTLPIFIDIVLKRHEKDFPIAALLEPLKSICPHISAEPYQQWGEAAGKMIQFIQGMMYSLSALVICILLATICLITHSSLAAHHKNISLLRLIGTPYAYISKYFQQQAFRICLIGAGIGLSLSSLTAYLARKSIHALGFSEMSFLTLSPKTLFLLIVVPLSICGLSMLLARISVLRVLIRLDR